jgi:peptidyl-prolyl cis-trans isomerase D
MFDLFRSRTKAVRYLLTALLSVVALSMVAYLVPGSGGGAGPSAAENTVATICGEPLYVHELNSAIQNVQRNQNLQPGMLNYLVPQLVEQLITERAVNCQASRMGLEASEEDTANAIRQQFPMLFQNGQFVGKDTYEAVLSQQNMSVQEFERTMTRQVLLNRLRSVVLESIVVTNADVEREFRQRNEKVAVEYAVFGQQALGQEAQPTPEEVKAYFERNRANYTVPEKRNMAIVVVDPASVEAKIQISEADIERAYNEEKDRFRTPDRVKTRHILLKTEGKSKEEIEKIKAQAESLLKQVKGGGNFAELAKKYSEDTNNKDKGGDLGWVERGRTVPEFEKAIFALKPGETSSVIQTQYGFHIAQAEAKEDARLKPLSEVKGEIEAALKKERGQSQVQKALDEVEAELRKNPEKVDEIAARRQLYKVDSPSSSRNDPIPMVGITKEFEDAIADVKAGQVSSPVPVVGNRYVIAVMRSRTPARPAQLADVERDVAQAVTVDKAKKLADDRITKLLERAKALNGDLKTAAKEMKADFKTAPEFTRNGAIEGLGAASSVPEVFTKKVGEVFGPVTAGTTKAVVKVTAHIDANLADLGAQREAIRNELKQQMARERNTLFEDGIRQALEKSGKVKVNQEVMKRVLQTWSSRS